MSDSLSIRLCSATLACRLMDNVGRRGRECRGRGEEKRVRIEKKTMT